MKGGRLEISENKSEAILKGTTYERCFEESFEKFLTELLQGFRRNSRKTNGLIFWSEISKGISSGMFEKNLPENAETSDSCRNLLINFWTDSLSIFWRNFLKSSWRITELRKYDNSVGPFRPVMQYVICSYVMGRLIMNILFSKKKLTLTP